MDFNRSLADAEFVGDYLVRFARHDEIEDLALAVGQAAEALVDLRMKLLLFASLFVGRQRFAHPVE